MVARTLVLLINICGASPALRVAAKRYKILKMKKLILFLFLFTVRVGFSQESIRPVHGITLGYFNDRFGSHGMRAGYDYTFYEKTRPGINPMNVSHAFLLKVNLSFFRHPRADLSFVLNVSCGYRYTTKYGLMVEPLHLGFGGMHSFLDGKTYEVDNNGNVISGKRGYSTFVLPYVQVLGLGYDFRQKTNIPLSFMASIDAYSQRNINTKSWLRLATPISLTYYLK